MIFEKSKSKVWSLRYIGHTSGTNARARIRNHLIKKSNDTGAKLTEVQKVIKNNGHIGISFLEISPVFLRHAVEEILIEKHSNVGLWNKRGLKRNVEEVQR